MRSNTARVPIIPIWTPTITCAKTTLNRSPPSSPPSSTMPHSAMRNCHANHYPHHAAPAAADSDPNSSTHLPQLFQKGCPDSPGSPFLCLPRNHPPFVDAFLHLPPWQK